MKKKIKILVLCTYQSTYVLQLFRYVKQYFPDIQYSLFTQDNAKAYYQSNLELSKDEKIYSFGNHDYLCYFEAKKLPHFDIIHSLWMEHFWGEIAATLRSKCDVWLNSVGGSDLYRESTNKLWFFLQKRIISRSDWISAEGLATLEKFSDTYGHKYDKIPHSVIRFGIDILEYFNGEKRKKELREKYHIPYGKYCIMCGTNARIQHQHKQIIKQISEMPDKWKEQCCLLLPMTYGGHEKYIAEIEEQASSIMDTVVIREYLTAEEMAELAIITDVLIHVQTTDQLSSIMLSHMYHGNVVIAGAWLPYQELRDRGIQFISINKMDELNDTLTEVIENLEEYQDKYRKNAEIVYQMSSWKKSASEWHTLYCNLMKKEKISL